MARFSIYSRDGQTVRYSGKPKYSGSYLKVPFLEFNEIASPVKIDWQLGDYVDYSRTGLRYKLYSLPQPKKQGRNNEYGASYVYSHVQLFDATKELEIALAQDLVLDVERNIHFSTRADLTTYENVYGIADRCQASIDAFFPGKWVIRVMELDPVADADLIAVLSEPKEFSLSNGSVLGMLNNIYNVWEGIGWIHTYDSDLGKDVVTIGRPNKRENSNTTSPFLYGLGNGLTAIKKSYTNEDEFATRLYVYGSTRNLPDRYYNSKPICNAQSVDICNLMLPLSRWGAAIDPVTHESRPDAALCYLEDAQLVAKYGLVPKKVYFDGSQNSEEVYPSVKNLTAGKLREAKVAAQDTDYVPRLAIYPDAERLDQIKGCTNPVDNGRGDTGSYVFSETKNVAAVSGSGVMYNSTNAPDHDPVEFCVYDYTPTKGASRVDIEPEYSFFVQVLAYDTFTVTQRIVLDVRLSDGTLTQQVDETSLGYRLVLNNQGRYVTGLCDRSLSASGTIERIRIYISIDRERTVATDMNVGWQSVTNNAQPIFFGFKEKYDDTFQMVLKQIGFNITDQDALASDGIGTISMKDGMCGGRDFTIKRCTYREATDDWLLTVKRFQDDSTNMLYPNALFPILAGDTFVLVDIVMPDLYVSVAEQTLLALALELYADMSHGKSFYEPEINAKKVAASHIALREGMYMPITDADIVDGTTEYILIDTLTISEDESNIPTYKVTLREKKQISYAERQATALQQMANKILSVVGDENRINVIRSTDPTPEADDNVYSALRSQLEFLSKKYDDIAHGLITFMQGATFGNFAGGITGFGGRIDGSGNGELDSLTLRRFLEVPELRYNRTSILVGNSWRAPGGGIIESVVPDYDANGNLLNSGTITLHLEDGEIGLIAEGDICMGIFHDDISVGNNAAVDGDDGIGNFHFSGFYTTYFRVDEILDDMNTRFRYVLRPASENWPETFHPSEAMHFVAYGNFTDTDRQTSRYSTRTYERYLKDVNDWEFTANNIGAQFGDLSNLDVFGLDMSGYSAYLNNIYMSGVIEQFELLPYRMEIDTEGQDTLAYGEHLDVVCSVWKGWDDVTSEVVTWRIVRESSDPLADAAWNLSSKATNFRGTIRIEHGSSYSDLDPNTVSTIFRMTATLADASTAQYTLEV